MQCLAGQVRTDMFSSSGRKRNESIFDIYHAWQLCHPAEGINWLVLYAAQQWNNYMNGLYKAVENAIDIVRGARVRKPLSHLTFFYHTHHRDLSWFGGSWNRLRGCDSI